MKVNKAAIGQNTKCTQTKFSLHGKKISRSKALNRLADQNVTRKALWNQ